MKQFIPALWVVLASWWLPACMQTQQTEQEEFLTRPFVHPGMSQSLQDLEYMRHQIGSNAEPWKQAYDNLRKETALDFTPQPVTEISVGPYGANSIGGKEFSESAEAAYRHALMWYITREEAYAQKAIEILNAWSYILRGFDANNAKLNVGLMGYYFMNAAEIIRHTEAGWSAKDQEQFTQMVMAVFYPTIKDFFTEANGNWDASMISTMMCIGVFTDNHTIFNRAVERFYRGEGNSGITRYLYPGGQCQETTRDWDHVQLGLGEFSKAAQTAATQGLDFYSVADDRLAQGYEYACRYLSGGEIDLYGVFTDRKNDKFKDVYESIYHHYLQQGIRLPYTEKVIRQSTRATSSLGLLTAIKAPQADTPETLADYVPFTRFLSPTVVGAPEQQPAPRQDHCIRVQPGASIQAAIDEARHTGQWIELEAGVHTLNAPLKLYSGTRMSGQGRSTILFPAPGVSTAIIQGEPQTENITLCNLLIEGAMSVTENADPNHDRRTRSYMNAPSREGIILKSDQADGIRHILIENVTVQNFTKNGVAIVSGEDIHIRRCNFSDNGASVVPGAGFHHNLYLSYITGAQIEESRFDTSPFGNGIDITFCQNIEVIGSETARNGLSGIRCAESQNIRLENNLAEGNGLHGIFAETLLHPCQALTVRHNLLQNNRSQGLEISTAQQPEAEQNTCRHNGKAGA